MIESSIERLYKSPRSQELTSPGIESPGKDKTGNFELNLKTNSDQLFLHSLRSPERQSPSKRVVGGSSNSRTSSIHLASARSTILDEDLRGMNEYMFVTVERVEKPFSSNQTLRFKRGVSQKIRGNPSPVTTNTTRGSQFDQTECCHK